MYKVNFSTLAPPHPVTLVTQAEGLTAFKVQALARCTWVSSSLHRLASPLTALRPLRRRRNRWTMAFECDASGVGCCLAPSPAAPSPGHLHRARIARLLATAAARPRAATRSKRLSAGGSTFRLVLGGVHSTQESKKSILLYTSECDLTELSLTSYAQRTAEHLGAHREEGATS